MNEQRVPGGALLFSILVAMSACTSTQAAPPSSGDNASAPEPVTFDAPVSEERAVSTGVKIWPPSTAPERHIRFDSADGATARRAKLVDYVWGHPLPTTTPDVLENVAWPADLDDLEQASIVRVTSRVDRLDARVDDTELHSISYVLWPSSLADDGEHVAIIHAGHTGAFYKYGLGRSAAFLLERGWIVIAMAMPVYGWNATDDARWSSHGSMFDGVPNEELGRVFRYFLEPIVQTVTWATSRARNRDVVMFGVSGGGWATVMASAVDPRIRVSMEVAGSAPLYLRNEVADIGDREQHEPTLYAENIAEDGTGGGVATWLEVYALAGYGEGRQALQVNNELDPCCFAGHIADSYAPIVTDRVRALGAGSWKNVIDVGSDNHEVSEWAMRFVLAPAIGIEDAVLAGWGNNKQPGR